MINRNVSPQPVNQLFTNNNNNSVNPSNINVNMSSNEYDSQIVPALRKKKNAEDEYLNNVAKVNESIMDPLRSPIQNT